MRSLRGILAAVPGRVWLGLSLLCAAWLLSGCASSQPPASGRPFVFGQDTFSYSNELVWEYKLDPVTGRMRHQRRDPPASYSHRCFVMARAALQFYRHARFVPERAAEPEHGLRRDIARVAGADPRRAASERVVITGYTNLYHLSAERGDLLKEECGGPWESYFQRGHWRMVFPLSRAHQARQAAQLAELTGLGLPVVVHLVRFPRLTINHAVVLYAHREDADTIQFSVYDPNAAGAPTSLTYDRGTRTFSFPPNYYFSGGRVDVYQVYHRWHY